MPKYQFQIYKSMPVHLQTPNNMTNIYHKNKIAFIQTYRKDHRFAIKRRCRLNTILPIIVQHLMTNIIALAAQQQHTLKEQSKLNSQFEPLQIQMKSLLVLFENLIYSNSQKYCNIASFLIAKSLSLLKKSKLQSVLYLLFESLHSIGKQKDCIKTLVFQIAARLLRKSNKTNTIICQLIKKWMVDIKLNKTTIHFIQLCFKQLSLSTLIAIINPQIINQINRSLVLAYYSVQEKIKITNISNQIVLIINQHKLHHLFTDTYLSKLIKKLKINIFQPTTIPFPNQQQLKFNSLCLALNLISNIYMNIPFESIFFTAVQDQLVSPGLSMRNRRVVAIIYLTALIHPKCKCLPLFDHNKQGVLSNIKIIANTFNTDKSIMQIVINVLKLILNYQLTNEVTVSKSKSE